MAVLLRSWVKAVGSVRRLSEAAKAGDRRTVKGRDLRIAYRFADVARLGCRARAAGAL
jgi:histone H3/H4